MYYLSVRECSSCEEFSGYSIFLGHSKCRNYGFKYFKNQKLNLITSVEAIKLANHGKLLSIVGGIPDNKSDWNILSQGWDIKAK